MWAVDDRRPELALALSHQDLQLLRAVAVEVAQGARHLDVLGAVLGQALHEPEGPKIALLDQGRDATGDLPTGRLETRWDPSWSPDSKSLAVGATARRSTTEQIYRIDPLTTATEQLTAAVAGAGGPVWSQDRRRILYLGFRSTSGADVWVMNSDGTGQHAVTRAFPNGASFSGPQWFSETERVEPERAPLPVTSAPTTRVLRSADPLAELDADGSRVAFTTNEFVGVHIWSTKTGLRSRINDVPEGTVSAPTIAGTRLLWFWTSPNSHEGTILETATLAGRRRGVSGRYEYARVLAGAGSVLAFGNNRGVWTITGTRASLIHSSRRLSLIAMDRGRIAVVDTVGALSLLRIDGTIARSIRTARGPVAGLALGGVVVVTMVRGRIRVYDARTGRLRHAWPTGAGGSTTHLEDVRGNVIAYVSGIALHLLDANSGRDVILDLPDEAGPAHARLTAAGLIYSYNQAHAAQPGTVGLVSHAALAALLR